MSLGLREGKTRKRREARWRLVKWAGFLVLVLAAGYYAYQTGDRLAAREVTRLEEQIAGLSARIGELEQENVQLSDAAVRAGETAKEWQRRYQEDIPAGELKRLYELTRQKLAEGVDGERLRFLLTKAVNRASCDEAIETKRFYVKTPLYSGANDSVAFGGSAITVTAEGQTSVDKSGKQQARYDPAKPVTVRFARLGGKTSEANGKLPLHHAIVLGDNEYRFSIVAGKPGMMKVTAGRCAFP